MRVRGIAVAAVLVVATVLEGSAVSINLGLEHIVPADALGSWKFNGMGSSVEGADRFVLSSPLRRHVWIHESDPEKFSWGIISGFPSFESMMSEITDQRGWTLKAWFGGVESDYNLRMYPGAFGESDFPGPLIIRPSEGEIVTDSSPEFQWQFPQTYPDDSLFASLDFGKQRVAFDSVTDQLSWTPETDLVAGQYTFYLWYNPGLAGSIPMTAAHLSGPDVLSFSGTTNLQTSTKNSVRFDVVAPEPMTSLLVLVTFGWAMGKRH